MRQYYLTFCLSLCLAVSASCQDSLAGKLTGKWGICYSIDTLDTHCTTPFNFYIFHADGTCQHGEMIIMNEKIPVTGKWKLENGAIKIVFDKHPNYSFSPQIFPDIVFINDQLFYYKVLDKYEATGHWVYFSLRKLE